MDILQQMTLAKKEIERMGPPPQRSISLHPDDYAELRRATENLVAYPAPGTADSIYGLLVVVDPKAQRLPRKVAK